MSVKDRLSYIDDYVNRVAHLYGVDSARYNKEAAYVYDLLRQSWEAFIERELLNQTVLRHDTDVQTKRLLQVEILDEDCARINGGMSKSSTWMAGHDTSMALDVNRPAPKELRDDIQELRSFYKAMDKRRKDLRERRKKVLEPQVSPLG